MVCLSVLAWFSTIDHRGFPTVDSLKINTLKSLRSHGNKDVAVFNFDLHADLSPAFNWNIKQLFVFVVAEYRTKTHPLNQVVVWDKIVESPEDAVFHMDKDKVKYVLIDQGTDLRNTTVNLRLVWDHMPITGRLYMDSLPTSSFKLPGKYQWDQQGLSDSGSTRAQRRRSGSQSGGVRFSVHDD